MKQLFKIATPEGFENIEGEILDIKAFDKYEFFWHKEEFFDEEDELVGTDYIISEVISGFQVIKSGISLDNAKNDLQKLIQRVTVDVFDYKIKNAIETTKRFSQPPLSPNFSKVELDAIRADVTHILRSVTLTEENRKIRESVISKLQ